MPPDGVPRRYAAFKGETLLDVLMRNDAPNVFPDCGGGDGEYTFSPAQVPYDYYSSGVHCGQCHVMVSDPHFDKLNKKPSTETYTLERGNQFLHENSRLACCIQIRPELNEMIVSIAGSNRSDEGEFFDSGYSDAL